MIVEIRDIAAVKTLRPLEVATYLRSSGWTQRSPSKEASTWTRTVGDMEYEAVVPLHQDFRDYGLRMAELLRTVASAEGRTQIQTFKDLLSTFADVIRIRIDDPESRDGTLSLESNSIVAQKARDLMMAAACSATEHRAVWHSRKPAQAIEHLRKVRVGQSERGSYILTVITRVDPALQSPKNGQLFEADAPFERQVTQTLAESLSALDIASSTAALTGEFASFEESVNLGVSANLCDAVAGLGGDQVGDRQLEFLFSWSPGRPLGREIRSRIKFSPDQIPVIKEAARLIRERAPVGDFELEGAVVKLDRAPAQAVGRVTIIGNVDGKPKRVSLELSDSDYHLAVQAHDQEIALKCTGTLVREGRAYRLQEPRDVVVEE